MLFVLFAACIASASSAAAPPRIEVQRVDANRDGTPDTIITIRTTTPTGDRRLVRTYSGVDGKLLGSYTLPRRLDRSPDFDGDGVITARDVAALLDAAVDPIKAGTGVDLTGDGVVSANDVAVLIRFIGDPPPQGPMMLIFGPNDDPEEYYNPCGLMPSNGGLERAPCPDGPGGGPGGTGGGPDGLGTVEDEGGGGGGGGPPNDPPLCTVTIEPAPGHESLPRSIGVWTTDDGDNDDTNDTDDLPTVKAQGSDPQGTYSWTIVQGGDKIELLDAATGAAPDETTTEIRIRGVLQSVQLNDVQIKVTHTTADGACSMDDMLELTAILATLTFRPMDPNANPPEMWSDDNDVNQAQFGGYGFIPQLGFITPTNPVGAIGHFKSMETRAMIAPGIDGLEFAFDFRRQRLGTSFLVIDGQPHAAPGHCPGDPNDPQAIWCDDDAPVVDAPQQLDESFDEDLTLSAQFAMYQIDAPGLKSETLPCNQQTNGWALLNIMNFRDWLTVDGFKASNSTRTWHASTSLGCIVDDITGLGSWVVIGDPLPELLGTGFLPANMPIMEAPNLDPEDTLEFNHALELLGSERFNDNMMGGGILQSIIYTGAVDEAVRARLILGLVKIIQMEQVDDPWSKTIFSRRATAIRLLGDVRAVEAVPVLLDHAAYQVMDPFEFPSESYPSISALVRIGEPAVGPILERGATATEEGWHAMSAALRGIDRKSLLARQAMRTLLDAQTLLPAPANEEEKAERVIIEKRLNEFLKTPAPIRPKPAPPLAQFVAPDLAGDAVGSTELH